MIRYSNTFILSEIDFKGVGPYRVLEKLVDVHDELTLVVDYAVLDGKGITTWSFQYDDDSVLNGSSINRRSLLKLIEKAIEDVQMDIDLKDLEWKRKRAGTDFESSLKLVQNIGKDKNEEEGG